VQFEINGVSVTAVAVNGSSDVDGDQVEIRITFDGDVFSFLGWINPEETVISGTCSLDAVEGSVIISLEDVPATLTRLVE
jgi:hypothetical protein